MFLLSAAVLIYLAYLQLYATAADTATSDYPYLTSPDVFPSPNATGAGGWDDAFDQANAFVARLNLTEKAMLVTGYLGGPCVGNIAAIPRVNFRGICLQDGPNAVRTADKATVFPAGLTVAASWDKDIFYQRGVAIGEEFRGKGAHVYLGPVAGPLGRHPLGGRNWEGFSPDPYLTGVAMSGTIKGVQQTGVQACAKHFIGNEQETRRSSEDDGSVEAFSANIDDRTLHELYLWPFADSVKAGVASFMCSYSRLNQTYACENSKILNGVLKTELGFQGHVMSDWFATHSGVRSIESGLDMNMPGPINQASIYTGESFFGGNVTRAVSNGSLPEWRVDDMVRRIMTPYFLLGQDSEEFPSVDPSSMGVMAAIYGRLQTVMGMIGGMPEARDVRGNHGDLVRKWAAASTVLLKNTNETLPLNSPRNLGVFGNDAPDATEGSIPPENFVTGTLSIGGGSGSGRLSSIVSPLEALKARAKKDGTYLQYITDNSKSAANDFSGIYPIPEVCLVFLKTWAKEGEDRTTFEADWNSTAVVNNVASFCLKTVVVTHSGGINTMPWADNPNVTAILAAHYPGEQSGNAIVDVLYGDANPSGKLPYTIARNESDYNTPIFNITGPQANESAAWQANYEEGLMIDYRHFDAQEIEPLYEFGFGLSYTTFEISGDLSVAKVVNSVSGFPTAVSAVSPGGNPELFATVLNASTQVTNTGDTPGAAVVQLYVSFPEDSVPEGTPVRVLRGFEKVLLQPSEVQPVNFNLTRRDLSVWDVEAQDWKILPGEYNIRVGFSSRDLRADATVSLL
ncbi:putative beta-glucosidase G [Lasiodiplodia theobromae]|uniref:Probable beta-glucosidase G n=1 Tax=Lasiodiplodia theobromae TaxID=45133 RepID=A0A5N5DEZ8_9PEZI|nr:putative beta-glucosidase G [Lasiodiplodia theobromae]